MAHMIEATDSLFVAGEPAWHGLGTVVQDTQTSADALRLSGLDWDVIPTPVMVNNKEVEGYQANVRSDTGEVLGVTSTRYAPVINRDAFAFTDELLCQPNIPVRYSSAGSLNGGKRVWLLAELPTTKILGDNVMNYLFFLNSHDGKSSLSVGMCNVRICCSNTVQLALKESPRIWTTRHMGDMASKRQEALSCLGLASNYIRDMSIEAERLASMKISRNEMLAFLDNLFPEDEGDSERVTRNVLQIKSNIIDIYENKDDLANFRGNAWGVYNAVADYVSNSKPLRQTKNYKESLFVSFLDGNKLLQNAQRILQAA